MNRRYLTAIESVLFSICAVAFCGILLHTFSMLEFTQTTKVILDSLVVLCGYFGVFFYCLKQTKPKKRRIFAQRALIVFFVFYLIVLIDFTLLDDAFGRNIWNVYLWKEEAFVNYMNSHTNIVPFSTIKLFITGYRNHNVTLLTMLRNILGNIVAFMPFAFFIPAIFKKIDRAYKFFAIVLTSVMVIELLQFIFLTGSSDIDDVILNTVGAMLFYYILNTKLVSRFLSYITFGNWNYHEKKN